jgi:hypothetical protein
MNSGHLRRLNALNGGPGAFIAQTRKAAWKDLYNHHAEEQTDLSGELSAAWSKLEEYAARLALVIHFTRWAASDADPQSPDAVDAPHRLHPLNGLPGAFVALSRKELSMSLWHELPAQNDRGDVAPDSSTCHPREPPGGKPWCYSTFSSALSDRTGFEHPQQTSGKTAFLTTGGTESGTLAAQSGTPRPHEHAATREVTPW